MPITTYIVSLNPTQASCTRYNIMWLSLSVTSTNKTDYHDISEILLKVALNFITVPSICRVVVVIHIYCQLTLLVMLSTSSRTKQMRRWSICVWRSWGSCFLIKYVYTNCTKALPNLFFNNKNLYLTLQNFWNKFILITTTENYLLTTFLVLKPNCIWLDGPRLLKGYLTWPLTVCC